MICRLRRETRFAVALALTLAAPSLAAARAEGWAFTRLQAGALEEAVAALALQPRDGSLVIGDARGVGLVAPGGARRRLLRRGPVRDLAFLPEGMGEPGDLLVATAVGLWRVDPQGRGMPLVPAPGAEARDTRRLAVSGGAIAVATGAGAFISTDAVRWRRLSPRLPRGAARTVALRADASGLDCYAVVDDRLWRLRLVAGPDGLETRQSARELLPVARESGGPVDVVLGLAGNDAVAVLPGAFAVREVPGAAWRAVLPALPPGASAQRLLAAHGRLWLATDRGLLVADVLEGPWRRAPGSAGIASVGALAADESALYVGAGDHVWVARAAASRPPVSSARLRTPEGDPPIELVQRAALAYVELRPGRMARLRSAVARRGWLPILALRVTRARDVDRKEDYDEAFLSGDVRRTRDRQWTTARDFETTLTFSWDLGDVLYHPEEIDVSREAREVIKLRDDVLDEVNQLYFERRRAVAELGARPDATPGEKLRLRLRAAELAAGLDAWTGGWFSRARAGAP